MNTSIKKNLVSVIITTYNRQNLVIDSINSVLKQTYSNIEIIVVNDGSTDDTQKVLSKISNKRVKIFNKRNGGIASARNFGLKKAKGEFISFLDDDDLYLPQKIDLQVKYLKNNKGLSFCYTNMFLNKNNKRLLFINKSETNSYLGLLLGWSFVSTITVMLRKNCILSVGYFDESIKIADDVDYWLRAAKNHRFGYIDKPLAVYRIQDISITKNVHTMLYNDGLVKIKHLVDFHKQIPDKYKQKYHFETAFQTGKVLYYEGWVGLSRIFLFEALKSNPFSLNAFIYLIYTFTKKPILFNEIYKLHMMKYYHSLTVIK